MSKRGQTLLTPADKQKLIDAAAKETMDWGLGRVQPRTEPTISFRNVDGPMLSRLNGTVRWLTWGERFAVWLGRADAWTLEAKDRAKVERR